MLCFLYFSCFRMSRSLTAARCSLQSGYFWTKSHVYSTYAINTSYGLTMVHNAWVFCPKKESLAHPRSTTTSNKPQISESHKSKFSPERDTHNHLFINLRSSACHSENTRRRNHRTSPQLHASVGVWILALVQFLGGILGLARPPIYYHLPRHRKN